MLQSLSLPAHGSVSVTSVGATSGVPETAALFSSGGFSNTFPQPDYQFTAVTTYLDRLGNQFSGLFNSTSRAYPDVAAIGDDIEIVFQQEAGLVAGTTASASIFASVIALINDVLLATGKPTIGFLNPLLYVFGSSAFFDITKGSNPGCNTPGFPAMSGWDPVSRTDIPSYASLS